MIALKYKYDERIIKLLINKKNNINQRDKNEYTPLMYALEYKHYESIINY